MTGLERTMNLIEGRPVDRLAAMPIIMLWASARYGHSYADYTRDYRILCDCQLRVRDEFELDILQLISDPVRETADCGAEMIYYDDNPPRAANLVLAEKSTLHTLSMPDPAVGRMGDRVAGAASLHDTAGNEYPIMGWVEGPIAEYADLRGVENTFMDLIDKPEMYLQAAKVIVENGVRFARAQIEAGADMIGIGDAVASLINPAMYEQFVLPFEKTLIDAIHEAGATVKLHICGNIANNIALMARTGAEIIDVDWMVSLSAARDAVGPDVTLAGNFNPTAVLLQGTPDGVAQAARDCIASAGAKFILQPGCEVPPGTPEANLRAFCPGQGCLIADDLRR